MSSEQPTRAARAAAKPAAAAASAVDTAKLPSAEAEKSKRPRIAKAPAAVDTAELPAAEKKGKRPRAAKAPAAAAAAVDTAELPPAYEELAALHHAVFVICDFLSKNTVICTFDTVRAEVRARARRELRMEDLRRMVALDNDLALRAHDDGATPRRWQVELVLRSNEHRSRPARQKRFRQLLVDFCSAPNGAADARALPLALLPPGVEETSGVFGVGTAPAQPPHANQPSGGFVPDADVGGGGAGQTFAGASGAAGCVSPERRPRGTSPGGSVSPGSGSSPGWSPQRRALKRSLTGLPSPPPRPLRRGTGSILEAPTSSSPEQQRPHNAQQPPTLAFPPPPRVSACDRFLERLVSSEFYRGQVAYVHDRKAKSATLVATPAALNPHVAALLSFAGIPSLYSHQVTPCIAPLPLSSYFLWCCSCRVVVCVTFFSCYTRPSHVHSPPPLTRAFLSLSLFTFDPLLVFTPSSVVKCLWEVFGWGFEVLFLSYVCRCQGCCSLSVCV